jgi:hypothetical protein
MRGDAANISAIHQLVSVENCVIFLFLMHLRYSMTPPPHRHA